MLDNNKFKMEMNISLIKNENICVLLETNIDEEWLQKFLNVFLGSDPEKEEKLKMINKQLNFLNDYEITY
jgi:hypothetical protein